MKKFLIVLTVTLITTAVGLYFRPSFVLIGQLDWINVLTKGYYVGSIQKFFTQGMIDESFYYVMRFTAGGLVAGLIAAFAFSGSSGGKSKSSKKK